MKEKPLGFYLLEKSIKNKTIIEDSWKGFKIKVISKDAPDVQISEMRKAYYCGFYSNFDLMSLVSSYFTEEEAMKILDQVKEQCENEIKKIAEWDSIK